MSYFGFIGSLFHWGDESHTEQTQERIPPKSYSEAGMEAFRSDNWDNMEDGEKLESLQQLSDEYCAEIGISDPPTVVPVANTDYYGVYVENTNQLEVDLGNCTNPYEAVDTVIHEDTHAYQTEAINSELSDESRYSDGELAVLKSENGTGYASAPERGDPEYDSKLLSYDSQSLELDANSTAFQYVSEHCSDMKDDPAYFEYITYRDEHFQRVNSGLNNKTAEVNASETAQINEAFIEQETSEEEWNLASQTVQAGNTTFRGASNEAGAVAHQECKDYQVCIDGSIAKATELHANYNECMENGTAIKTEDYQKCIGHLEAGRWQSQRELNGLREEQNEYISSHNMGFREVAADETCREYRAKIESCKQDIGQYNYHIAELSTDVELSQENGLASGIQSKGSSLSSGLGENAGSSMDNGQSM